MKEHRTRGRMSPEDRALQKRQRELVTGIPSEQEDPAIVTALNCNPPIAAPERSSPRTHTRPSTGDGESPTSERHSA